MKGDPQSILELLYDLEFAVMQDIHAVTPRVYEALERLDRKRAQKPGYKSVLPQRPVAQVQQEEKYEIVW
jgi:hypothetical protein